MILWFVFISFSDTIKAFHINTAGGRGGRRIYEGNKKIYSERHGGEGDTVIIKYYETSESQKHQEPRNRVPESQEGLTRKSRINVANTSVVKAASLNESCLMLPQLSINEDISNFEVPSINWSQ